MKNWDFETLSKTSYSRYKWTLSEKFDTNKYDRYDILKSLLNIFEKWENFRIIEDYFLEYIDHNQYHLVKPQLDWEKCVLWQIFFKWDDFIFLPVWKLKLFLDSTDFLEDDDFEISKDNEKEKLLNYFKRITQQLLLKISNSN